MAIEMQTGFTEIPENDGIQFKFKNFDRVTFDFPIGKTTDPQASVMMKTVEYAYVEGTRLKLADSEHADTLKVKLSEVLQSTELSTALYYIEQAMVLLKNYKNGDTNLSYTTHS